MATLSASLRSSLGIRLLHIWGNALGSLWENASDCLQGHLIGII